MRFFSLFSKVNTWLFLGVIVAAIGVICIKQNTRFALQTLYHLGNTRNQLYNQRTRLLLEQSAWTTYARIDKIAKKKLNMDLPTHSEKVLIQR